MAVPRPVLLVLLGIALCAAAFLATRGAREPGGAVTAVPAPTPAAPVAHAPKPAKQPATHGAASSVGSEAAKHAGTAPAHKAQPSHAPAKHAAATKPAERSATRQPSVQPSSPAVAARVKQALAHGDVVVFFFTRAGAADDTAARQSVASLHGMGRVMVVKAGLEDLTTYSPVLSGAGVSQVPSIVVVHAHRKARLLEGYVDPGTLRQTVADALR